MKKGLLKEEHEVTILISVSTGIRHENLTEEVIQDGAIHLYEKMSQKVFNGEVGPDMGSYKTIKTMFFDDEIYCLLYDIMKSYKIVESLVRNKSKVDLMIVPGYMGTFLYYLSEILQCPLGKYIHFHLNCKQFSLLD